jgi:hypothetical protein
MHFVINSVKKFKFQCKIKLGGFCQIYTLCLGKYFFETKPLLLDKF